MTIPFMPQNKLFRIVFLVLVIILFFTFLPFILGGGLIYLFYKKVPANNVRNALMLTLGALTLFIGSAWTMAFVSPSPTKQTPEKRQEEISNTVNPVVIQPIENKATVAGEQSIKTLYAVTKVVDGDTLSVTINGKPEVIRLIGIDSPETVDPRKPVQCFGKEASQKAKELLEGKKVSLETDPPQGDKDKYNRLLRYIYLEDGTSFNKLMISEGYAHEYTYNLPYKYQLEYKEAEKTARENKKGLWADKACPTTTTPPQTQPSTTTTQTQTAPVITQPTPTTPAPVQQGSYTCSGKTTCGQMTSCAEANFYLNNCGVSRLDGDKDGTPCETLCN